MVSDKRGPYARSSRFCMVIILLIACIGLIACEGDEESSALKDAIEIGTEGVVSLQIRSEGGKNLFEDGERWQFTVEAIRSNGSAFDVGERVQWSIGDSSIASVDSEGQFTARAVSGSNSTEVLARWGPFSDAFSVTVSDAELVTIAAAVQENPVDECLATKLSAEGIYSDGSRRPLTDVTWSVSDAALASIAGDQLLALNSGNIKVSAARGSLSSNPLAIVISDSLNEIRFSQGATLNARSGESLQLKTLGAYASGEADITAAISWSSANQALLTVNSAGLLEALSVGEASVSAACGGLVATIAVTVINVSDVSIVDPEDADIEQGEKRQLELYRVFSDGSTGAEDLADSEDVVWDIDSGGEIASISATGEVTLADDLSNFEDSFIRVFAEYEGFEDTLVISLDR